MRREEAQTRPRTLGFVPVGIILSMCGLVAGLIGWMLSPRRANAIGLLHWGVVLSLAVLGLDLLVAVRGIEAMQIHAFR
jgi:hypothetical protein